jgi:hypothetical protein
VSASSSACSLSVVSSPPPLVASEEVSVTTCSANVPTFHPTVAIASSLSPLDGLIICQERRFVPAPIPSAHPLVVCLQLIRTLLHLFLVDDDAARLLRVSHNTTCALLPGFAFRQYVFVGESQAQMLRMRALYEAYDVRPTRMCLSADVRSLSLEKSSGRSPFPPSLTSLILGPDLSSRNAGRMCMFGSSAVTCDAVHCPRMALCDDPSEEKYESALREAWPFPIERFEGTESHFDCILQPGLLPHGLRRLQCGRRWQPAFWVSQLLPGSIPSTVEILQLRHYDQ